MIRERGGEDFNTGFTAEQFVGHIEAVDSGGPGG